MSLGDGGDDDDEEEEDHLGLEAPLSTATSRDCNSIVDFCFKSDPDADAMDLAARVAMAGLAGSARAVLL